MCVRGGGGVVGGSGAGGSSGSGGRAGWGGGGGEEPAINVVCAEVAQRGEGAREGGEVEGAGAEGGSLDEEDAGLGVDCAEEDDAAAGLVWVVREVG